MMDTMRETEPEMAGLGAATAIRCTMSIATQMLGTTAQTTKVRRCTLINAVGNWCLKPTYQGAK
jgi:hypothetical protein